VNALDMNFTGFVKWYKRPLFSRDVSFS